MSFCPCLTYQQVLFLLINTVACWSKSFNNLSFLVSQEFGYRELLRRRIKIFWKSPKKWWGIMKSVWINTGWKVFLQIKIFTTGRDVRCPKCLFENVRSVFVFQGKATPLAKKDHEDIAWSPPSSIRWKKKINSIGWNKKFRNI